MTLSGLPFPYDRLRNTSEHGFVTSFLIRIHPLALWIPFMMAGVIIGWFQ
jgi:hypothetical protein